MYKQSLALSGLQGFLCHKTSQTKLENVLSLPKNLTFSLKSDQINLFTNIWPNRIKNYQKNPKKNLCLQTHIEDKTNLTFLGIKWPTEVDMPLNKTQTCEMPTWLGIETMRSSLDRHSTTTCCVDIVTALSAGAVEYTACLPRYKMTPLPSKMLGHLMAMDFECLKTKWSCDLQHSTLAPYWVRWAVREAWSDQLAGHVKPLHLYDCVSSLFFKLLIWQTNT